MLGVRGCVTVLVAGWLWGCGGGDVDSDGGVNAGAADATSTAGPADGVVADREVGTVDATATSVDADEPADVVDAASPSDAAADAEPNADGPALHDAEAPDVVAADEGVLPDDAAPAEDAAVSVDADPSDLSAALDAGATSPQPWSEPGEAPDLAWANVPPDRTSAGVELVDPGLALPATVAFSATPLAAAALSGAPSGAFVGWQLEPSGPLAAPVYLRLPLPSPRVPGEELWLVRYDEDELAWVITSVAVVLPSGMQVLVATDHFSTNGLVPAVTGERAFVQNRACPGGSAPSMGPNLIRGQRVPPGLESAAVGALRVALSHDLAACVLSRAPSDIMFKNEEDVTASLEPHAQEDSLFQADLIGRVRALSASVRAASCDRLDVVVTEAFDSQREHSDGSLHYEGRAVDLSLVLRGAGAPRSLPRFRAGLGRLGRLALEAGFGSAYYEPGGSNPANDHVHASVPAPAVADAAYAATLAGCRASGVRGLVRVNGANATAAAVATSGGSVNFETSETQLPEPLARSLRAAPVFVVDSGASLAQPSLPALARRVAILGALELGSGGTIDIWESVWIAPGASLRCPGCSLTIRARGPVLVDGVIDLRPGGTLRVEQLQSPEVSLPAIDARGGDGLSSPASGGATGGSVTVRAAGDVVLGRRGEPGGFSGLDRLEHGAQGGNSWTVRVPAPAGRWATVVTAGGVGGQGGSATVPGQRGGDGGPIDIAVTTRALGAGGVPVLGRWLSYRGALFTGGASPLITAMEIFNFNLATPVVGPIDLCPGGLGGRGGISFANANGGAGGAGGNGGALTLRVSGGAANCPPLGGATMTPINGLNGATSLVGQQSRTQAQDCELVFSSSGGSGGVYGGSVTGGRGQAGAAGTAGALNVVEMP
jgi:hypothetical protein